MKLIVDTDMGIDDAIALLMLLDRPEVEIEAITTVAGNISLDQATHNVGVVLDVANGPAIPFYRGCARPLLPYEPEDAAGIHGPDGLGGAGQVETRRRAEAEHASPALVRLVRENPGQITLLVLGPLTNVALALRLDPELPQKLKRLVVMGGAVDGRGNTTSTTEFNIGFDPEAAKIVFAAAGQVPDGLWLVPWETSLAYALPFAAWYTMIAGDQPVARFVRQMTAHLKQVLEAIDHTAFSWPDPLAAAVAISPALVTAQEHRFVEVEVGQGLARGQTIVDYRPQSKAAPNLHIVRQIDMPTFQELLRSAVEQAREQN